MTTTTDKPIVSYEVIIHGSDPIVVMPVKFTIYARGSLIENFAHYMTSRVHPDYDWFIIGEIDRDDPDSQAAALEVFRGMYWTGHVGGMDDYYPLLDELRTAVFQCLTDLFPLAVFPDQED